MNKRLSAAVLLFLLSLPRFSLADIDLDQEVLIIPDTHNAKPYLWNVERDPAGYELLLEHHDSAVAGANAGFTFTVKTPPGETIKEMHVFITDSDLHTYQHVRPVNDKGVYRFSYDAPWAGRYRFEIVFMTAHGWINLRRDVSMKGGGQHIVPGKDPGDEDYAVKITLYPKKIYAEHVGTFLYEIKYKGNPLRDREKIDGFDMLLAAWDEDRREFVYATPAQNLGGPEVAVSLVFMKPGKHAVFAEFKHRGVIRRVDLVITVLWEPREDSGLLPYLKPAD